MTELAREIDVSEGTIRHYETGYRSPSDDQIAKISKALGASENAIRGCDINSAKDLVGMLLLLEDDFGLIPNEAGTELKIDPKQKTSKKTMQALKAWAQMRNKLASGEITQEEYEDWKSKF